MVLRDIIKIDEELCDGCGQCVPACAEGALKIVDGKARLVSEVYCDGLGACLGECPQGAITIEKREAPDFDAQAVEQHLAKSGKGTEDRRPSQEAGTEENEIGSRVKAPKAKKPDLPCGCPGSAMRSFDAENEQARLKARSMLSRQARGSAPTSYGADRRSALGHWPVQLMLVPAGAPFLKGADILICADCVPFAVPDFHSRYLRGRSVLVGCPKLDDLALYRDKLQDIFESAEPKSITVLRMEVPCCGGIAKAVIDARDGAGLDLPVEVHTLGIRGGSQVDVSEPRKAVCAGGKQE